MSPQYGFNGHFSKDDMQSVIEIDDQIKEEIQKDNCDNNKVTQLMFEQLLRGINVTQGIY